MFTLFTEPPAYTPARGSDVSHDLRLFRPSSSTPPPAYTERTVRKLRITSPPGAGILNASILDAAGRVLYTTSSDAKLKKTSVRRAGLCLNSDAHAGVAVADEELARFGWDRSSPRVRFGGGDNKKRKPKVKCKEWLPLAGSAAAPDAHCRSRVLTLDGVRYTITERKGGVGCLLRADDEDSSLLPLARWRTTPDAQSQRLEVFEDACGIPGLFDAFVLALVVMQCEQPLGDAPDGLYFASPKFYGNGHLPWGY